MTQHELIIKYIEAKGYIEPARLSDIDRRLLGDFIGSEAGKRCREMVGMIQGKWKNPFGRQMLTRKPEGKFMRFYLLNGSQAPNSAILTKEIIENITSDKVPERVLKWQAQFKPVEKVKENTLW